MLCPKCGDNKLIVWHEHVLHVSHVLYLYVQMKAMIANEGRWDYECDLGAVQTGRPLRREAMQGEREKRRRG